MSLEATWARVRGRQRQTGSLCVPSRPLLRRIVAASQETRFGPFVTPQTFELASAGDTLASGRRELEDGPRFFTHFEGQVSLAGLAGRDVLDLGCGYGGRTVYYALEGAPKEVVGTEISGMMVDRCRALADQEGAVNTRFLVGFAEDLPFRDGSFDLIVSYDVLEHVQDPVRAYEEMARVLRPGGEAWLVFPTYLGARSSHLDYLTQVPLLHRVFDPDAIIDVVNEFLTADPDRYGVKPQPRPAVGALGRRVLPTVNGTTLEEARAVVAGSGLRVRWERVHPMISATTPVPGAAVIARLLEPWTRIPRAPDVLVGQIVLRLVA